MLWVEDLPFMVVLDNDGKGRSAKEEYAEEGVPDNKIILLPISEETQKDADIEDMFSIDDYTKAFYEVHGQYLNLKFEQVLEKLKDGNGKITNKAQAILGNKYKLDKGAVAYAIRRIVISKKEIDNETMRRFSYLLDKINEQLEIYKIDEHN